MFVMEIKETIIIFIKNMKISGINNIYYKKKKNNYTILLQII